MPSLAIHRHGHLIAISPYHGIYIQNRKIKGLTFTTAKHELIFDSAEAAANEEIPLDVTCMSAKILETRVNGPLLDFLNITINALPD